MSEQYKAYSEYKDSGVEWLGEVPIYWQVKAIKRDLTLLTEKTERRTNSVALENIESWTGRFVPTATEFQGEGVAFEIGDILFGKLRPYLAKALLSGLSGEAVGDFHVMHPTENVDGLFIQYQILTPNFIDVVNGSTFGAKMPRASWDFVGNMPITYPPLPEQKQIAKFLDHETGKIDLLIEKQQALIALLKEKRQAVISHAVTKGLNPHAKMKDSGVEWLGEVPEEWEVGALSYALNAIGDVDHYMPPSVEKGVPYVMTGDLEELASEIDLTRCKQVAHNDYHRLCKKIKTTKGDLIMARYATIGTVSYVDLDSEFLVSYSCVTIKPNVEKAQGRYLFFCLKSDSFIQGIQERINTNTQGNVGIEDLKKVKVALPALPEQKQIARFLDHETGKIDLLIEKSESTSELIQERCTALISAAVTGKIDVRDSVAEAQEV